jgi:hypothetical protein
MEKLAKTLAYLTFSPEKKLTSIDTWTGSIIGVISELSRSFSEESNGLSRTLVSMNLGPASYNLFSSSLVHWQNKLERFSLPFKVSVI